MQQGEKRVWIGWPLNYWRGHLAFTAKQVRLVSALSSTQERLQIKLWSLATGHHLNPTVQVIWNRCAAVMGNIFFFLLNFATRVGVICHCTRFICKDLDPNSPIETVYEMHL